MNMNLKNIMVRVAAARAASIHHRFPEPRISGWGGFNRQDLAGVLRLAATSSAMILHATTWPTRTVTSHRLLCDGKMNPTVSP